MEFIVSIAFRDYPVGWINTVNLYYDSCKRGNRVQNVIGVH